MGMEKFYIGGVKVILDDLGEGRGSIIVSDGYDTYEHFWGSMGHSLKDFLLRINSDYFSDKLMGYHDKYEFDAKGSLRNLRAHIKEVLPWYEYMSAQKELRAEIGDLKYCNSQEEFVNVVGKLHDNLMCLDLDRYDEREFLSIIENEISCEPWHLIESKPNRAYLFLQDFLPKLQKHIKKEQKELVQVNN